MISGRHRRPRCLTFFSTTGAIGLTLGQLALTMGVDCGQLGGWRGVPIAALVLAPVSAPIQLVQDGPSDAQRSAAPLLQWLLPPRPSGADAAEPSRR